ncbi:hypothetical protein PAXRUDRAFT_822820 [Paxillus rubicundulus Ve08.2h10]|uniref:Uncharacterized protein n=1 Tax=Paxillus rubicundulus Ve08.2h10 TaxID=930991 RepID=A0A0D0DLE6_9AGAM|nr:hypothetical protein PAXRUDRAFT_822820 [Paxillus rubicundulus Ve08.2h10]
MDLCAGRQRSLNLRPEISGNEEELDIISSLLDVASGRKEDDTFQPRRVITARL